MVEWWKDGKVVQRETNICTKYKVAHMARIQSAQLRNLHLEPTYLCGGQQAAS